MTMNLGVCIEHIGDISIFQVSMGSMVMGAGFGSAPPQAADSALLRFF